MYADPGARGGVLEPEGMVEIKFRKPELVAAMHRLDGRLAELKARGLACTHACVLCVNVSCVMRGRLLCVCGGRHAPPGPPPGRA